MHSFFRGGLLVVLLIASLQIGVTANEPENRNVKSWDNIVIASDYDFMFPTMRLFNFKVVDGKLLFDFPEKPVKITTRWSPYILKCTFITQQELKHHSEECDITLFIFGTELPFEDKGLTGNVHGLIYFKLSPKLLKQEHLTVLLDANRKVTPLEIVGHIFDREADVKLSEHPKYEGRYVIKITIHPESINGVRTYKTLQRPISPD